MADTRRISAIWCNLSKNVIVPTQFKIHILSHPNQTSPNKNLVLKLAHSLLFSHFKNLFVLLSFLFSHSLFLIPSPFSFRFTFPPLFTRLALQHTGLNRFSFPFSNFPYFTRVFRLLIPFWFQPYHRSSNKTESNWIENEKRKKGWKWV